MKAKIEVRKVFGVDKVYPVNDVAKAFADVAGTKTLTIYVINIIKSLGITVEEVLVKKLS